MQPKRVLVIPGRISGGVGSVVMNLFRNIDKELVHYDFCVSESDKGKYDDEILAQGSKVFRVPRIQKAGPLHYIESLKTVIENNGPYDAVHIHSVHMGALALMAAKKAGIDQRIYHVHSTKDAALEKYPFHRALEKLLSKLIIRYSTTRLACGQEAGQYIYGNNQFIVINNAIDLSKFTILPENEIEAIRDEFSLEAGKIVIGRVANFNPEKNTEFFIKLAEEDIKGKNRCVFLLVGDGEEFSLIKQKVIEKNLSDKIVLTGNRVDTERLYNAFDLFCLPSLFEGLPVTAIEAQACGLPVLTSTNVTEEADLGVANYARVSLEEPTSIWVNQIYAMANEKCNDTVYIRERFISHKYDIESVSKEVERLYCVNDPEE